MKKITEISTPLHPQAKVHYALIVQCDTGQLARVQMSYVCHLNSLRETSFHTTFWGQLPNAQQQEEQQDSG